MSPLVAPSPASTRPATGSLLPAIVIGAGMSGLTCAYSLRNRGLDAHLFESSNRAGGVIQSLLHQDFLFELGPQSFTITDSLSQLIRDLNVSAELLPAPPKLPRFLFLDGQLVPAPLSPPAFFTSSLFSARTKLSILRDLLGNTKPPSPNALGDESIAHFVRRKFSAELLDKLVGPFVSGIYAGDPEKLALRSAFPQLYEAESSHGSILRGMIRARKKASTPHTLATFKAGNQTLPDALAKHLDNAVHLGVAATGISTNTSGRGRYLVHFRDGSDDSSQPSVSFRTDRLILATPSDISSQLLAALDPEIAFLLAAIPYAPIAVVSLGYRQSALKNELRGFGFLVPRSSSIRILGSVWNSAIFDGRAPDGTVLLTSFVGGTTDPLNTKLSLQGLQHLVHSDLKRILDLSEYFIMAHAQVWPRAIPQYDLDHHRRSQLLARALNRYPGLALAGNYLDGPAIGSVVDRARKLADYILDGPPQ
jgi:protoporphyrinogen/coproporphyrinogen III oxidase